jgi:hypothetical protein
MANDTCVLFINKSAKSKSLSRSKGEERARIFSHVQRNPQVLPERQKTPPEDPTVTVWQLAKRPKRALQKPRLCKESPERESRSSGSSPCSTQSLPPRSALGLAQYDPFGITAVPIQPEMSPVLQFYSGALLDRVFVNKALADVSRKYTLAYAAEDAVALYAILCAASAALYCNGKREKDRLDALHFKCQAIQHLKQELENSIDSTWRVSTAYAVALLLWVECLQCDVDAAEAHTRGLDFLLSRVHGIENSPFAIMTTIITCQYYCSSMLQVRPLIKSRALNAEAGTESMPFALYDTLRPLQGRLCSAFFTPPNLKIIGPHLAQIILNQTRCLRFKVLWDDEYSEPTHEDLECSYTLQGPVDLSFIDLPYQSGITLTPVQDAVRLAFWALTQSITRVAPTSSSFSRSMARQLKAAIDKCSLVRLWEKRETAELLLWILFAGLYNSRGQQEWPSMITYTAMTLETLGIESEKQMEDLLSRYVYSAKFCGEILESAWRDVRLMMGSSIVTV